MNPANFAELKSKIDTWDISAEELLLQKMKIFTINYNEEFQQFCKNMDNFANHIESLEVEHLKAINKIKTISRDKFIENALNKGEESDSESCSNENNLTPTPNEIQITNVEKMKSAIDICLNCLEEINRKNKNKEEIEDDAVSVASSKLIMDKGTKVRLPFIIGSEEFKAEEININPNNNTKNNDVLNNTVNGGSGNNVVHKKVKKLKVIKKKQSKPEENFF